MSKSKAYVKFIGAKGSNSSEERLVNQSSPAWVLTFVRWNVRDTLRAISGTAEEDLLSVRKPLVVENDCVQLAVNVNKSNLTHSFQATLLETDVNYSTAIHPGDFCFVNMLNWESSARRIAEIGRSHAPGAINGINDGFKGFFKVQGVRKIIVAEPTTGTKRVMYRINGFAFTEFNNSIYYNPYLSTDNQGTDKDSLLFITNLAADYRALITPTSNPHCQDLIKLLIQAFVGDGVSDKGEVAVSGIPITANTHFFVPQQVGAFLGNPSAKAAKDTYNYLFGIQKYNGSSNVSLAQGMNPSNLGAPSGRFYATDAKCNGQSLLRAEYWNQVKAWSIIQQYTNSPLNELYTCFRVDPSGKVMPTVVFRQIPFSTDYFGKTEVFNTEASVTQFSTLPRWKISPALIYSADLGLDESARFNFVQFYASPPGDVAKKDAYMSVQTAAKNFVYDINDVKRSGLRPYVINSSFEDLTIDINAKVGKIWAQVIGDSIIGGHLKLNGTLECVGIAEPIAVGDNLEFDGTVFHIEEVNHVGQVNLETGIKTFRSIVKLSNGVAISDNGKDLSYSEMVHTVAYRDREDNYNNGNKILPGIGEEQDTTYRPTNPSPTQAEIDQKDKPFAQPGTYIRPLKDDDNG